jgi:hypothetical protein
MKYHIELDKRSISELKEIVSWYNDSSAIAADKFETAFKLTLEILSKATYIINLFPKKLKQFLFLISLIPFITVATKKQTQYIFTPYFTISVKKIFF